MIGFMNKKSMFLLRLQLVVCVVVTTLVAVVHVPSSNAFIIGITNTKLPSFVQQYNKRKDETTSIITSSSSSSSLSLLVLRQQQQNEQQYYDQRRFGGRSSRLHMGWGPEPIWSDATIVNGGAIPACESGKSVLVQIAVPEDTAKSYTIPGQYIQLRPKPAVVSDDNDESSTESTTTTSTIQPLFLAIASAPPSSSSSSESNVFEFLIKKNEKNTWVTSITDGTIVEISQVLGNGYTIAENIDSLKYDFPTQNILLFAAGSGIAPIAAAIRSNLLNPNQSRTCRLYYGERTASDLCYIDQYTAWEQDYNIQVVPVLSGNNDEQDNDDWNGRIGYVQTALEEDGISIPRNTAALLCGMKGMTESVKTLLQQAGVFEGRILFNF